MFCIDSSRKGRRAEPNLFIGVIFSFVCFFSAGRHTAVDVELKPAATEPPPPSTGSSPLYPPPPPFQSPATPTRSSDVTRSEPNLNGSQPEPVILKAVPSLKNLSEHCLPDKISKMHVKGALNHRLLLQSKSFAVDNARPIYPNCPFSPYVSPTSSPRTNRKRQPLKESRRVSIEKSGMYLQLNQYKLMDSIGQVGSREAPSVSRIEEQIIV
jgi:hypothetical protein